LRLRTGGFPGGAGPAIFLGLLLHFSVLPDSGEAQGFNALVSGCAEVTGGLTGRCHVAAHALWASRGGLGTALSMGSDLPGSASTLGFHLRKFPKISLGGRVGLTRFSFPEIREGYALPLDDQTTLIPALHLSGAVGVWNGISATPSTGGILSLDLIASGHLLLPPEGDGFQAPISGWSAGARIGILRESFTLPGITLSVSRHWVGEVELGEMEEGDAAEAGYEPEITSFRLVVGKDILGAGMYAGGGLDRTSGPGTLGLRVSPTGFETRVRSEALESDRTLFFAGGSMTYLIVQISGEMGLSQALDAPLPVEPGGSSFPSARAYFGSLAVRITF
jgi:hypothetical protein